jgi:hypothetical protein
VWIVEPLKGTELSAFAIGGVVVVFFHWFLPHCKLFRAAQITAADSTMLKISSAANATARPIADSEVRS